jgi:hypothetical protein
VDGTGIDDAIAVTPQPGARPVTTRPASIVAFICGLLLCVPFLTQLLAICVGVYAVGRKQPGERIILAWVGIILGVATGACWVVLGVSQGFLVVTAGPPVPPFAATTGNVEDEGVIYWSEQMARVHRAAAAYRRDFREWPTEIADLAGHSLPRGFALSQGLDYRPPPPSLGQSNSWVLVVSDATENDMNLERLGAPHRLVLRLGGKIELLPASDVENLLATQPMEELSEPAEPSSGD